MRVPTLLTIGVAAFPLFAQRPVISPGGVVNAASFAPVSGPTHAIVPGAIASIFGQNLAAITATAESYPLTQNLAGSSVTVNGIAAALFFVSPTQINFQVPSALRSIGPGFNGQATLVVTTGAGASDAFTVDVWQLAPGVFTQDGSGCGQGAILNVNPDGSRSLNSPSDSASPGDYIEVYATGLGETRNVPPDGTPAPAGPFETTDNGAGSFLEFGWFGFPSSDVFDSIFRGGAPGLVGVDQINFRLPANVVQGCAVPLQIGLQ